MEAYKHNTLYNCADWDYEESMVNVEEKRVDKKTRDSIEK